MTAEELKTKFRSLIEQLVETKEVRTNIVVNGYTLSMLDLLVAIEQEVGRGGSLPLTKLKGKVEVRDRYK